MRFLMTYRNIPVFSLGKKRTEGTPIWLSLSNWTLGFGPMGLSAAPDSDLTMESFEIPSPSLFSPAPTLLSVLKIHFIS